MRQVADEYDDRLLIGEDYLPLGRMVSFYGLSRPGVNFPFNFKLMEIPWEAARLREAFDSYYSSLAVHDWPNWVLSNHDRPRVATRVGPGMARLGALLLLTLRGTPTIYYGDELGMGDGCIPLNRRQDPRGLRQPGYELGATAVALPCGGMPSRLPASAASNRGCPWGRALSGRMSNPKRTIRTPC